MLAHYDGNVHRVGELMSRDTNGEVAGVHERGTRWIDEGSDLFS